MKKIALLMVLVLTLCVLAGCGGSGSAASGTYELISIKEGDMSMAGEELESYAKLLGVKGALITMELTSDGKASIASPIMDELSGEGTYKVDGSKITVTIDGDPIDGTLEGGKITLANEDLEMVFQKK